MSTSPMVQFTPESVAAFKAAINETVANTRRTMPQVVLWASQFFCVSARKHTPRCKARYRDIRHNPEYQQLDLFGGERRSKWPYQVKVYQQAYNWQRGGLVPSGSYRWLDLEKEYQRVIKFAGVAQASWNGALKRLGRAVAVVGTPKGQRTGGRLGWAHKALKAEPPHCTIIDRVSYLPVIAPTLLNDTLGRTTRSMERQLSRSAVKEFRKSWRVSV